MKKIYLSLLAAAAMTTIGTAQKLSYEVGEKSPIASRVIESNGPSFTAKTNANAIVQDTLWYFFNKHFYRNTPTAANSFYTFNNANTYTATNAINAGGAVFLNPSTGVAVSGLEAVVAKSKYAGGASASIPVTLYLFNVNAGLPTGPAVASCTTAVTSTLGSFIGCNFTTPTVVVGDYAVVMRNTSSLSQDTIKMFMNNARTTTSSATAAEKFGEGLGILGVGNTFGSNWAATTNVFNGASFGSDFEFLVAPRVTYSFTANHNNTLTAVCNTTGVTYVNTTTGFASHRQYNLNKFAKSWAPFSNTVTIAADSIFTWNFGGTPPSTDYNVNPTHTFVVASNGNVSNQLIVKIQKMSDYSAVTVPDVKAWTVSVTICNVGLTENSIENQFAVYPNPATDKVVVMLNNVNKDTQIQVLNALGQVVLTRTNLTEKNELNTESFAKGVYFVRVSNGKEASTSKLIINK